MIYVKRKSFVNEKDGKLQMKSFDGQFAIRRQ